MQGLAFKEWELRAKTYYLVQWSKSPAGHRRANVEGSETSDVLLPPSGEDWHAVAMTPTDAYVTIVWARKRPGFECNNQEQGKSEQNGKCSSGKE